MFARLGRPHAAWLGRCWRLGHATVHLGRPRHCRALGRRLRRLGRPVAALCAGRAPALGRRAVGRLAGLLPRCWPGRAAGPRNAVPAPRLGRFGPKDPLTVSVFR